VPSSSSNFEDQNATSSCFSHHPLSHFFSVNCFLASSKMVEDEDYRRKAKIAVITIIVLASLAVFASFVAFAYYCYISNKVSKRRRKSHKGFLLFFVLFVAEKI
jgi:hypothetical protein